MSEELKAALARIACLEGEIAKRDETIARLEPQLNRAIQANYDLREELAACRVAVENCELFRVRIVELEHRCGVYGLELHNATERLQQAERQIKAIKAQEPVAWAGVIEDCASLFVTEPQLWKAIPPYVAPVSEAKAQGVYSADPLACSGCASGCFRCRDVAKAQGVVMPEQDGSDAQIAFWAGFESAVCGLHNGNIRAAWNDFKGSEQFKRFNAAPVQQVGVPDDEAVMAKARELFGWAYGLGGFSDAVRDLVEFAHPAAPAADAGDIVLNASAQEILSQCIGAHAYVLGVLANGRPDLAFIEAKKWVDAFKKAATQMEPSHD